MKKAVLLSMCLLGSCGKKVENHYYEKPSPIPPKELEVTCEDSFMRSYVDLQLQLQITKKEYTRLAKFDSVSRLMAEDLKVFNANLKQSHKFFNSAFGDVESCNGVIKNKTVTITPKDILNESNDLLNKIQIMLDSIKVKE